jgi:RES domain-containing protein
LTGAPTPLSKWRISAFADLSGRGGLMANGRWHHAGQPVVYLADTPAGAMLEMLVHLEIDPEDVPDSFKLLRIELPKAASRKVLRDLPADWENALSTTRTLGDQWLAAAQTLLLSVPSAIMPHTHNLLLNPLHGQASQLSFEIEPLHFDKRLLHQRQH